MKRLHWFALMPALLAAGCGDSGPPAAKEKDKDKGYSVFSKVGSAVNASGGPIVKVPEKRTPTNPDNPIVLIDTSMGPIKAELFADKAPGTVKNFLDYVDEKFFDGTVFHRVMPGFMIQGGGFEPGMKAKPTKGMIKNESDNGLINTKGTLAMARQSPPDSATCQFFINTVDNAFLDRANSKDKVGYCVFAQVLEGMDVVDKIKRVPTSAQGPHEAVPTKDVVIQSIRRADAK